MPIAGVAVRRRTMIGSASASNVLREDRTSNAQEKTIQEMIPRKLFKRALSLATWLLISIPLASVHAEQEAPELALVSPTPGSALSGTTETFTWTDVSEFYWLDFGTSPYLSNIKRSGLLRSPVYTIENLPTDGSTVYVRLWSVGRGGWQSQSYSFASSLIEGGENRALEAMVSVSTEKPGRFDKDNLIDGIFEARFRGEWWSRRDAKPWAQLDWEEPIFIDEVVLYDLSSRFSNVLEATLSFSDGTSQSVGPLPADGAAHTIEVGRRLVDWVRVTIEDSEGFAAGLAEIQVFNRSGVDFEVLPAQMISPAPDSSLPLGPITFDWNKPRGVDAFFLQIGTEGEGSEDIFSSEPLTETSFTLEGGLDPTGEAITVTLSSFSDALDSFVEPSQVYEYNAPTLISSELISPTPNTQLEEGPVTFDWEAAPGIDGYILQIGTDGPRSQDIFRSARLEQTTYTLEQGFVPTGETITVTLHSYDDETSSFIGPFRSYDFTAPEPPLVLTSAMLLSPAAGTQLPAGPVTFTWNEPEGIEAFILQVGTGGPRSQDIFRSPRLETASYTLEQGVPATGEPITVTLQSYDDDTRSFIAPARAYDYTAPSPDANNPVSAVLLSPEEGTELGSGPITFTWNQPAGVEAYILQIGTNGPRSQDIFRSPRLEQNTFTYEGGIPASGAPVTVTLWSYDDDAPGFIQPPQSYSFSAQSPRANLISPENGDTLDGTTQRFEWEALNPNVQNGYQLWVGTEGVGSSNIDRQSIFRTLNTALVDDIPLDGSTVYVRLRTLNRTTGEWTFRDYTFQAKSDRSSLVSVVSVFTNNRVPIDPLIYGVNNDWRRTTGENHTLFEEKLDETGYSLLRYPGGFESEFYLWEAAGETPANSTPRWNNNPAVPGATPEQVLASSSERGVEPTFVLRTREYIEAVRDGSARVNNTVTVNQQEAFDLLVDVADKVVRAYKDEVRIWEIGNEWYNFGGNDTQNQASYATIAGAIARRIKEIDPTLQTYIVAEWEEPQRMAGFRAQFEADDNWQFVDGLNVHIYAGDENEKHDFDSILSRMDQLRDDSGKEKFYVSEWNSSKAYTGSKIYMQGANMQIKQAWLMQRAGIELGAIWPAHETAITGLGLVEDLVDPNTNANTGFGDVFPSGTAFNWMSTFLVGEAVQVTEQRVLAAASRSGDELVVFLLGAGAGDQDVRVNTAGFNTSSVKMAQVMYRDVASSKGVASVKSITDQVSLVERSNGLNQVRVRINPGSEDRGSDSEIIMLVLEGDFTNP